MTQAWMNVLAALVISLQSGASGWMQHHDASPIVLDAIEVSPENAEASGVMGADEDPMNVRWSDGDHSNYIVVDRIDDDLAYLETPKGNLVIPAQYLPENTAVEGTVIEYRIATDEAKRRLDKAQKRIDRLIRMSEE